jgi:hypothetical protein
MTSLKRDGPKALTALPADVVIFTARATLGSFLNNLEATTLSRLATIAED